MFCYFRHWCRVGTDLGDMSITPALRAAARAAYRDLLRASSATFAGTKYIFFMGFKANAVQVMNES